jgi:hypothetical protein
MNGTYRMGINLIQGRAVVQLSGLLGGITCVFLVVFTRRLAGIALMTHVHGIASNYAHIPPVEISAPCRIVFSAISRGRTKRRTNAAGKSGGGPLSGLINAGSCAG